jgi:hypothetical protein
VWQLHYDESENAAGGGSVLTTLDSYGSVAQHGSLKQIVKGVVGKTKSNLPGAELVLFRYPFRTTPCPSFLEIVLILSCPLWTRAFNICCTFLPVPSAEEERLPFGESFSSMLNGK